MTLLDIERMVRKIFELLQQNGNAELAPKLAADYAATCQAANLRLQQCEAMIRAGDRPQAIQLAETAPNLLDLVTILEFRGVDEWRAYCQKNTLTVADRIDARSVSTLNECYGQGITTDHPLYGAYRAAVLNRNDEEALKILQSITRLNPTDANAAAELARLDAKVLAIRLHHLGGSVEHAEPVLVVAEIESIEGFGFKSKPDGEIWRAAQAIHCRVLLEEASNLKATSRWQETLDRLEFIRRLQNEFKIELSASELRWRDDLEAWARGEQEKDRKERAFQALLAELHHRIQLSEEKDTSARYVEMPELRDDYEGMHKVWRALTDFTRPIPDDSTASFRKRTALLEAEISRRTAIRRRSILAGCAVVLVIGGTLVWFVLGQIHVHEMIAQLREAVEQRQVHSAEKLLERVHADSGLMKSSKVNMAAADAETFLSKENALLAGFEAAFGRLPQQLSGEPAATRISTLADQLATARLSLNALAPDLKTENEPRLDAFEKQWQNFLTESGTMVNGLFDQWVASAETESSELDYRAPLEKTAGQMATLAVLVQKLSDTESGYTNHLNLRSDLLERSGTVRAKFD
ncbi:MAG TPA: hypothetical protein VH255_08275, partial [Verrucomicrobiae bacterium]|nr:hypothetical protein [Verrucomicrobiae bacterium]